MRSALRVVSLSALLGVPGWAADNAASRLRLDRIVVRGQPAPTVHLELTGPATPLVRELPPDGDTPARVYVDLPHTVLAPALVRTVKGAGAVRQVRAGQFDADTVRVVVELAEPRRPRMRQEGSRLMLALDAAGTAPPPAAAAQPAAAAPAAAAEPAPSAAPSPATVTRIPTALEDQIVRRHATGNWPAIVALYAGSPAALRRHGSPAARAAVVDALRELGLPHSARKVLGPRRADEDPALRLARAEVALSTRDVATAAAAVAALDERSVNAASAVRLRGLRARLALAQGDLAAAATAMGDRPAPELRAELAAEALAVGRAASRRGACGQAVAAYRHALDADAGRTARSAAAAGLAGAALACADPDATRVALDVLGESTHPLLRRAAAALLSSSQTGETRQARADAGSRGGG